MKIKRYSAKTEYDAMQQIKAELGDAAYILHTKKVKPEGFFGFLKKPLVEVMVSFEDNPVKTEKDLEIENLKRENRETKNALDNIRETLLNLSEEFKATKESIVASQEETSKKLKDSVPESVQNDKKIKESQPETGEKEIGKDEVEKTFDHKDFKVYKQMIKKGVCEELAFKITDIVVKQLGYKNLNDEQMIRLAKITAKDILGIPYRINENSSKRKVFFFIGPTGVGKTTTIAKIAAKLSLIEGKDVALITADTFRIAAVEQLKTYSGIMNVPVSVVYKPIELKEVLHKYKDKDFVFIDTAGKNHKQKDLMEYVKSYIEIEPEAEIFLLISLTTSYLDIESIVESYKFLDDYKLILTKLDESASPGNVLNVKHKTGKSTSFITNGQSVPDDIIIAEPDEIVNMLFEEVK